MNLRFICLFKIFNYFLRNLFLNFDKNFNLFCVMEGKKKEKNVFERVKRYLCLWWNNCILEMIVWKGKVFEFKCYCVYIFLLVEDIFFIGSYVFVFFNVYDFIFFYCIYILNLRYIMVWFFVGLIIFFFVFFC